MAKLASFHGLTTYLGYQNPIRDNDSNFSLDSNLANWSSSIWCYLETNEKLQLFFLKNSVFFSGNYCCFLIISYPPEDIGETHMCWPARARLGHRWKNTIYLAVGGRLLKIHPDCPLKENIFSNYCPPLMANFPWQISCLAKSCRRSQ